MRVVERGPSPGAVPVAELARRMVGPLTGLDARVGFVLRGRGEPRFAVAGGQLCGVHHLIGEPEPGSYHIGGIGTSRDEALVRALGESVERYCQLVAAVTGTAPVRVGTAEALRGEGLSLVDPAGLRFFTDDQLASGRLPFQAPSREAPYGWVAMTGVADGDVVHVPAQLVLVGYRPHRGQGEPWLAPAVTTGTATHRSRELATRGALLELVQIDAAMGHWYGPAPAPRIRPGRRMAPVLTLWDRLGSRTARLAFHLLPSPDLPGLTVACVLRQPEGRRPAVAVGLGCELRLAEAAYKALLEAVGVFQLAKLGMAGATEEVAAGGPILDLDSNVEHYARGADLDVLDDRFPATPSLHEDDVPDDERLPAADAVHRLQEGCARAGVRLYERDLTPVDVAQLSLVTARVWSPDLLPLAMPGAPTSGHPRFSAYGGARHDRPHPYP